MSDSVQPRRQQPTRLPHPWDSLGRNTGVGCHFLLQCRKVKSESEVAQLCPTLSDSMDCSPPGSSIHGIFQARVREWGAIAFSVMLHGKTFLFIHIIYKSLHLLTPTSHFIPPPIHSTLATTSQFFYSILYSNQKMEASGECVISLGLSHHSKDLKWWTSVTAL